jgi:putative intracellular protease/amidase
MNPRSIRRRPLMRALLRGVLYLTAFAALPLGVGLVGLRSTFAAYLAPAPAQVGADASPAPALDPNKPTVAIVLGNTVTEVADMLVPYAVFGTAGAFNVVAVAERKLPVALSGGLDVVPHFSFAELDARLGRDPDLIVVPNIVDVDGNQAVRNWVREHGRKQSLVMSICAGAEMLAATGLIEGRPATTHWGDIARLERSHPGVHWVRGQRYVDDGQFVSTAGILSGVDGSLHMIDRLRGRALALQVARALRYEPGRFLDDPSMPQFQRGPRDAIILLNAAFGWDRAKLGVALYDGMEELPLAAIYDTNALSADLFSVASPGAIITTRHGLQLVARRASQEWSASGRTLLAEFAGGQRFPFDTALEDVARRQNVPTAEFAAKRLEYRAALDLHGHGWSKVATLYRPLLLGLSGLMVVLVLERLIPRRGLQRGRGA